MKGLFVLTLAGSLLASASVFAQTESGDGSRLNPSQEPGIARIAGKKFYAVDGSSMTILAFDGGLAREIDGPGGAVNVKTFALQTEKAGTVSAPEGTAATGTFRLTDDGIATAYSDGGSEMLVANETGGISLISNSASGGTVCTAWYPEGHEFTSEERRAAVIAVADLAAGNARSSCGASGGATREARVVTRHRRMAANAAGLQTAAVHLRGNAIAVDYVVAGK